MAVDLSLEMLRRGREGIYSTMEVNRGLPARYLSSYFRREGIQWQVKPELRSLIEFRQLNFTKEQLHAALSTTIRTDPLRVAGQIDPKRMFHYTAAFDAVVGVRNSRRLWKASGRPQRIVIPAGHYGSVITVPFLHRHTLSAFRSHLATPTDVPGPGKRVTSGYRR